MPFHNLINLDYKNFKKTKLCFFMKKVLVLASALAFTSCVSGTVIKDVDFPATPIDMTKVTKRGEACFGGTFTFTGSGSILLAAKNGNIKKVHMVEYAERYRNGGMTKEKCTIVYGE